jgi:murein DD-endopeptidase MepM/ murein hydrolase activator NlpD
VRQGDVIGYVGTTGNAPANTPHLHFAITILPPSKEWWKGDAVDPYPILMKRGLTIPASPSDAAVMGNER